MNAREKLIEMIPRMLISVSPCSTEYMETIVRMELTPERIAELAWGEMNKWERRGITTAVDGLGETLPFFCKMLKGGDPKPQQSGTSEGNTNAANGEEVAVSAFTQEQLADAVREIARTVCEDWTFDYATEDGECDIQGFAHELWVQLGGEQPPAVDNAGAAGDKGRDCIAPTDGGDE